VGAAEGAVLASGGVAVDCERSCERCRPGALRGLSCALCAVT